MLSEIKPHEIELAEQGVERLQQKRREALHETQRLTNEISHRKVLIGRAYRTRKNQKTLPVVQPVCNLEQRYTVEDLGDWLK